ncbi:DUF1311 domain-containing protein [Mesorhizobium sp. B2-1-3]|uniref:lysozyme inhibitor LprI family protein n=1 Tax=Mesorhizobium sp. B2-1-3 TaxID=2589972 RepID=UPI001126B68D|nr:lysozyme inhibitor LprI family protein [Mesorhizobium sp. B2-1-3]TPN15422.1 DUF1311 domain-containing protein [Mesorhizobium sp. B2-1-3]
MRIFMTLCVAAAALLLDAPQKAAGASFDCSRARLSVERMICADALLSDLDEKLYAAFQAIDGRKAPELVAAQKRWIKQRNKCTAPTCVSTLYRERIFELSQLGATAQAVPGSTAASASTTPAARLAGDARKQVLKLPSQNDIYVQNADVLVQLIQKLPRDIRDLRFFQNYDIRLRSYFQFLTADQQQRYSKVMDDWWQTTLKEIGGHPIAVSDITLLQLIAPNFPPERQAQLRELVGSALSSGPGPALTNADTLSIEDGVAVEPTDREIWEGTAPCAPKNTTYDFVVLGSIDKANSAYVMSRGDQQTIVRYAAKYDLTIGTIDLSEMSIIRNNDFVTLPKSANVELEDGGSTLAMHLAPSCEVRLQRKKFPEAVLQAISHAKADPAYVPAQGLPFCVSMLAWSHQIQTGAPKLDLTKNITTDPPMKLLIASAFHDSMTRKFLGRPLTTLDTRQKGDQEIWFRWTELARECLAHPLYFDDSPALVKIILPYLNHLGDEDGELAIISTVENRVKQVAQAGANFSATADGFMKLRAYVSPLEMQLEPVLMQVRQAVLKPLIDREAEIAIVAVHAEPPAKQGSPRPLDRLSVIADMIDALRSADQAAEVASAETVAIGIVNADLTEIIALGRTHVEYVGADIFSLSHLQQWKSKTENELGRFSEFASYKTAMQSASQEIDGVIPQVVAGLASVVTQATDIGEIGTISSAVAELQSGHSDVMTSPMWQAYMRGLDGWFAAHTTGSAAVAGTSPASHGQNVASIFHSPELKNRQLVGAIFDHDFLALRNDQADAFAAIVGMVRPINQACPGTLTEKLLRAVLQRGLGSGVFGTSEDAQNNNAEFLLQEGQWLGKALNNPGQFMNDMVRDAAAQDRAEADGQLVTDISCKDPDMQTFFANAEEFLADPTSGIPNDRLGVAEMCTKALPANQPETAPYCACAGPILEQRLTAVEGAYLKSDPRRNYSTVVNLLPSVSEDLRKCQQ